MACGGTIALALVLGSTSASRQRRPILLTSSKSIFPAVTNVTDILVQKINAETVRVDLSALVSDRARDIDRWSPVCGPACPCAS
jgi:hypothetical protein